MQDLVLVEKTSHLVRTPRTRHEYLRIGPDVRVVHETPNLTDDILQVNHELVTFVQVNLINQAEQGELSRKLPDDMAEQRAELPQISLLQAIDVDVLRNWQRGFWLLTYNLHNELLHQCLGSTAPFFLLIWV